MSINPDRREAALDWLVRTNDPEFDRWDEFTAWLEESPANADAYHALAAGEADLLPLVEAVPPAAQPGRRPDREWDQRENCRFSFSRRHDASGRAGCVCQRSHSGPGRRGDQ